MKKISLVLITGSIICTAFNKPKSLPPNYRDAYVGLYFCKSTCQVINVQHNGLMNATDTITIRVAKDATDSVLDIIIKHHIYKVKLLNGILYSYPEYERYGGKFFSSDSISFTSSITLGPSQCGYKGKKN